MHSKYPGHEKKETLAGLGHIKETVCPQEHTLYPGKHAIAVLLHPLIANIGTQAPAAHHAK